MIKGMKKAILILFILSACVFGQENNSNHNIYGYDSDNISTIQFIEDNCVINAYNYEYYINRAIQCYKSSINSYKKEVNKNLNTIKTTVSKESYNQLIKSEKNWIKYNSLYDNLLDDIWDNKIRYKNFIERSYINKTAMHKNHAQHLWYIATTLKSKEKLKR